MKNTLAENMLRFGSKNLSEASKKKLQKLAEQEVATTNKLDLDKQTIFKQSKLTPFVSNVTGILYIPEKPGTMISANPTNITAYGITQNVYKVGSETYTFPVLSVISSIDVRLSSDGTKLAQGISNIDLRTIVDTVSPINRSSKLAVIEDVKNDASTWSIINDPLLTTQFINKHKGRLQLDLGRFSMQNEITKGVFTKPTPQIAAALVPLREMGAQI